MDGDWHYSVNGQASAAPVPFAKLRKMAGDGKLRPGDLVWRDGMDAWKQASAIHGLFGPGGEPLPAKKKPKRGHGPDSDPPRGLLRLPPLAVLVLTVLTAGLFSLVYAVVVCRDHAARCRRDGVTARARHPLAVAALSYLTFGVYWHWWLAASMRDCIEYSERRDLDPRVETALVYAVPFYGLYAAAFKLPELIRAAREAGKLASHPAALDRGALFSLLPPLLPVWGMAAQDAMNELWYHG